MLNIPEPHWAQGAWEVPEGVSPRDKPGLTDTRSRESVSLGESRQRRTQFSYHCRSTNNQTEWAWKRVKDSLRGYDYAPIHSSPVVITFFHHCHTLQR